MKKLKKRSQADVDAEIKRLEEMMPKVRRYTAFGDDNHKRIGIAIAVLRSDWDEDDISARYHDADENSEAYGVLMWKLGEDGDDGSPADQWQELVKP